MPITIRLKRNGPYTIAVEEADQVVVLDADGNRLIPKPGKAIALCRCGDSSTKPFCDGTHRENGFIGTCGWDAGDAEVVKSPPPPSAAEPTPSGTDMASS